MGLVLSWFGFFPLWILSSHVVTKLWSTVFACLHPWTKNVLRQSGASYVLLHILENIAVFPSITVCCIECWSFFMFIPQTWHQHRPSCRWLCFRCPLSDLMWTFKKEVFKELFLRSSTLLPLPLLMPLQKLSAMRLAFWQTAVHSVAWKRCGCVEEQGFTSDKPHCCKHGMLAGQICCLFLSYTVATACSFIYTLLICLLVMFAFVLQCSPCGVPGM